MDAAGEQSAKRDIESHGTRDSNNDSKDFPLPIGPADVLKQVE